LGGCYLFGFQVQPEGKVAAGLLIRRIDPIGDVAFAKVFGSRTLLVLVG